MQVDMLARGAPVRQAHVAPAGVKTSNTEGYLVLTKRHDHRRICEMELGPPVTGGVILEGAKHAISDFSVYIHGWSHQRHQRTQ